jgi:O-antigen ligase
MLIPASLTESRATRAAFLLGVAATIAGFLAPILARRTLVVLFVASMALPFCVMEIFLHHHAWFEHLPSSWQHRVEIWDYMSYRILEHPFLGWGMGMGSSRLLPYLLPHGDLYRYVVTEAANPHDAIIQLWIDLGLSGLALGLLFALLLLYKASRLPAPIAPFALGGWVAAWCISLVAYDFWSDSLFALFALTSLAFVLLVQQSRNETSR